MKEIVCLLLILIKDCMKLTIKRDLPEVEV